MSQVMPCEVSKPHAIHSPKLIINGKIWKMYGKYMDIFGNIYIYIWKMYGTYMEIFGNIYIYGIYIYIFI